MAYNFSELKKNTEDAKERLLKEYTSVRTGRATPALLDSVRVSSYGSMMAVNQIAAISVEDAKTIRVSPWDASHVKEIEKAVTDANLGVSVSSDDKGIRVSFPELTSERRAQLLKVVKDKLEQARISLRAGRDKTWEDIQKREKDKEFGEDEKFRYKDEMEKLIKEGYEALEKIAERKEKEISG